MATSKALLRRAKKLLLEEDLDGALACFAEILEADRSNAQAWADVGFLLADVGRREEALHHFERAIALNPRCAPAWVGKGMQLEGEAAVRCFDEAIASQPDSDSAWFLKSVALEDLGRRDEAAECLARARALSPRTYG